MDRHAVSPSFPVCLCLIFSQDSVFFTKPIAFCFFMIRSVENFDLQGFADKI